tara:strand:- start:74796 stop:74993 length:198 start_codon:yes stop_codon:yes gene_type:complete
MLKAHFNKIEKGDFVLLGTKWRRVVEIAKPYLVFRQLRKTHKTTYYSYSDIGHRIKFVIKNVKSK